jgi:WD40 repeat protein
MGKGGAGDSSTWKDWKYKVVRSHRRKIFTLGWNSEGKRLASGSVDQTVRITRVDDHCGVRADACKCVVLFNAVLTSSGSAGCCQCRCADDIAAGAS